MGKLARTFGLSVALAAAAAIMAGPASAQKKGGNVVIAIQAHPPTIDPQFTGANEARNIVTYFYETLVTLDENSSPIPDLAEKYETAADGLSVTFNLRKGVKFHNGKEMKAIDVKGSLERYAKISPNRESLEPVSAIEIKDDYTVVLKLKRVSPNFIDGLASPAVVLGIMPAEDAQTVGGKNSNIGTGPYRFVEWIADSHVKFTRFDGYVANPNYTKPDGYGGKKTAYFDTVTIRFVPEAGARLAGIETGELHAVEQIPGEVAKSLEGNRNVRVVEMSRWMMLTAFLNTAKAPTDDIKVRRAIQAAINQEEVMTIATQGHYQLNHALQYPENRWYTGAADAALYNQKNAAKAKQLLTEAGKTDVEIQVIASADFEECKNGGVVVTEQLRKAGFKVKLAVSSHPAYSATRDKTTDWNIAICGQGSQPWLGAYAWERLLGVKNNPMKVTAKDDPEYAAAWAEVMEKPSFEDRKAGWAKVEHILHEKAYYVKLGDYGIKQATRANLENFKPFRSLRVWDVWFR